MLEPWELIECEDQPCLMDECGAYVVISRVYHPHQDTVNFPRNKLVRVRADVMNTEFGTELMSFIGSPVNVYRSVCDYILNKQGMVRFSYDHAAYIGAECQRAFDMPGYVQDA